MSQPFVGEVLAVGFNFAPTGWSICQGQLMPISQNTALFSLLGTYYGGDGKSTFALPNLLDSVAVGQGQSPGGSDYSLGQTAGTQSITLLTSEIPSHTHFVRGSGGDADQTIPTAQMCLASTASNSIYSTQITSNIVQMNQQAIPVSGSSLPHNNMMPYVAITWVIALQGVFPARQ